MQDCPWRLSCISCFEPRFKALWTKQLCTGLIREGTPWIRIVLLFYSTLVCVWKEGGTQYVATNGKYVCGKKFVNAHKLYPHVPWTCKFSCSYLIELALKSIIVALTIRNEILVIFIFLTKAHIVSQYGKSSERKVRKINCDRKT